MGELSKLKPRKKIKHDCGKKITKITKWYRGQGDPKDIGNPEVYVLVCEQPWIKSNTDKRRIQDVRRSIYIEGNVPNLPCGYHRFCPQLYQAWLREIEEEKRAAKEKAEKKAEKEKEPPEPKEPEYVPEGPKKPEEPPEEELTDDVLLAMRKKHYPSYTHDDPHYQILVLIQKAMFDCGSPITGQARLAVRGASQHAGQGNYEEMEKCLEEVEHLIDSDKDADRIRSSVEKLYIIRHGPLPEEPEEEEPSETMELVNDPGDSAEELMGDVEYDEDESPETDEEPEMAYETEDETITEIDKKRREIGRLLSEARFNNHAGTFIWGAVRAVEDKNYKLMTTLLDRGERCLDSKSQKDDMVAIKASVEELYELKHGPPPEKTIND